MREAVLRAAQRVAYFKKPPDEKFFHFELRHPSPYKRPPLHQVMMLDHHRLMYLPIAKNACTSLKRLMAGLSGLTLRPKEDIHERLDGTNTGLMFVNREDADIEHNLAQPGWMRFIVIREPLERLVSAYIEKFVVNRQQPGVKITCDPVLMRTFKAGWLREEDYERGITFRQFVTDILAQSPDRLDPHWRPQAQYLKHFPPTHVYRMHEMEKLARDLSEHTGQHVNIPRANVSRNSVASKVYAAGAADMLPHELPSPSKLSVHSFINGDLRTRIEAYFTADIALYSQADHAPEKASI